MNFDPWAVLAKIQSDDVRHATPATCATLPENVAVVARVAGRHTRGPGASSNSVSPLSRVSHAPDPPKAETEADTVSPLSHVSHVAMRQSDEDLHERFEERAAIMEHDGGLSRELAERLAGSASSAWRCAPFGTLSELVERRPSCAVLTEPSESRSDPDLLLGHVRACEPSSYGGAATDLGIGASRAWRAEAALVAAGLVRLDHLGRMTLIEEARQ